MTRYAVLLRGVNVGGRTKLAMGDLRAAAEGAGFAEVGTYLQSGNAVLTAPGRTSAPAVAKRLSTALTKSLGACPDLLVRSGAELAALVDGNPFPAAVNEPTLLHVAFLSGAPGTGPDADALAPDEFAFGDRCVYLHYVASPPGRSRFGEIVCREAMRGRSGAFATVRNWNTVLALAERTAA